ncbi:MAG: AAA family ATPase [Lachnospiraceae bacterium]
MRIDIKDFAKIEEASIKVDGITVIAGENNTGKSTVGKILFALFNSTVNMEERVLEYRRSRISVIIRRGVDEIQNLSEDKGNIWEKRKPISPKLLNRSINEILNLDSEKKIYTELVDYLVNMGVFKPVDEIMDRVKELAGQIHTVLQTEEPKIYAFIIQDYFGKVFHDQVNNIYEPECEAIVDVCIRNSQHLELGFKNQKCEIKRMEFATNHEAVYIDSPFLLDQMNDYWYYAGNEQENLLLKKLAVDSEEEIDPFVELEAVEKLEEIFQKFDQVFEGQVIKDEDDEYRVKYHGKTLDIGNLSTGIKSFTIIRRLLEKGELWEKDVLILDEPEIHLHPQWQLIYAEIIVLLEKYFDLSIVITTHSHYFLDAIELFSAKYGISDKVNFYLSDSKEDRATFTDVTNHLELIYQKLAQPLDELDNIRYS